MNDEKNTASLQTGGAGETIDAGKRFDVSTCYYSTGETARQYFCRNGELTDE